MNNPAAGTRTITTPRTLAPPKPNPGSGLESCRLLPYDDRASGYRGSDGHAKAPALPPGAHRHVPRALWLFAQKQECRHLIGLETGVQVAESHYLAKRYRMMCSSITQLLFDFFRNSSSTTFEPAYNGSGVGLVAAWPPRAHAVVAASSRLCLRLTLLR